jgi:predicted transcriptional regulator with HTH domain
MTDATLYSNWFFWLSIASIIVVAAALLLILVWLAARRILNLAVTALGLVQQIKANTAIIWELEETNKTAVNILGDARRIRNHGASVAKALHETEAR